MMSLLGVAVGAAQGMMQASAATEASQKNIALYQEQARAEYASQQRELAVETNAAKKDGYQAARHRDLTISSVIARGEGMSGATAGQRIGEQLQQGQLSIENAHDRFTGAQANYAMASANTKKLTQNQINTAAVSPMQSFMTVATGALNGIGSFG